MPLSKSDDQGRAAALERPACPRCAGPNLYDERAADTACDLDTYVACDDCGWTSTLRATITGDDQEADHE